MNAMKFFHLAETSAEKVVIRREPFVFFLWNESRHITFSLEKSGAMASIFALFIGKDTDTFSTSIVQHHHKPDTYSSLTVLSILDGHAVFSYDGLIRIEKEAVHADASQANHNLLLSEHARANASPQLEILAHDVTAHHASATGTTNSDAMFSLEARGLQEDTAKKLLAEGALYAFFDDMRKHTDDPAVDILEKEAMEKLGIFQEDLMTPAKRYQTL